MATGSHKSVIRQVQDGPTDEDNGDDHDDSSGDAEQTLALVDRVKKILQERISSNKAITEENIEDAIFKARCKLSPDAEEWEDRFSVNVNKSQHHLVRKSIAYARTPEQVQSILQAKQEEDNKRPRTSLDSIIEPLKELENRRQSKKFKNLFAAVLGVSEDRIDRADRMFFSEACRIVNNPKGYTFEEAHDQVQAIRLMHYQTDDEKKLQEFIEKCPTFDTAYSYLRELARDRVGGRSSSALVTASAPNRNASRSEPESARVDKNQTSSTSRDHTGSPSSHSRVLYNSDNSSKPSRRESMERLTSVDNDGGEDLSDRSSYRRRRN